MHVKNDINRARTLKAKAPGSHNSYLLSSLRGQPIGLSAPGHHWMNRPPVQPVFDAGIELELYRVIEAGEVCQTGHGVDALVLANLSLQHSSDRNGEAVFVRACKVPWHILIQRQLPAVKLVLPVGVPQPVKA